MKNTGINIFFVLVICILFSGGCSGPTEPYLKHEVKVEKIGSDCAVVRGGFNMESNTLGERYVMERCGTPGFNDSGVEITRHGDTILISFPRDKKGLVAYRVTVDINTYPHYNYLTIGNETYSIVHSTN